MAKDPSKLAAAMRSAKTNPEVKREHQLKTELLQSQYAFTGSEDVDLIEEIHKHDGLLKSVPLAVKILELDYNLPIKYQIGMLSDISGSVQLIKVAVMMYKDSLRCYCEAIMVAYMELNGRFDPDKYKVGKVYTINGSVFIYGGTFPLLGYPDFVHGTVTPVTYTAKNGPITLGYSKSDVISPAYYLTFDSTINSVEYYKEKYGINEYTPDFPEINLKDLSKLTGLEYQSSFGGLKKLIKYPAIQIINGSGVEDFISNKLLDCFTGGNWEIFSNPIELSQNNSSDSTLKVRFAKSQEDYYPDLPTIDIRA